VKRRRSAATEWTGTGTKAAICVSGCVAVGLVLEEIKEEKSKVGNYSAEGGWRGVEDAEIARSTRRLAVNSVSRVQNESSMVEVYKCDKSIDSLRRVLIDVLRARQSRWRTV